MSALTHSAARDLLHALIDGELKPAEQVELEAHLAHCPSCELDLTELKAASAAMRRLRPEVDDAAVLQVRQAVRAARASGVQTPSAWPFNLTEVFPQVGMAAMAGMLMLLLGTVMLQSVRKREAARNKFVMARIEEQPALAPAAAPSAEPPAAAPLSAPAPAPERDRVARSREERAASAPARTGPAENRAAGNWSAPPTAPAPPAPDLRQARDASQFPAARYAPEPEPDRAAKPAADEAPRVAENAAPPAAPAPAARAGRAAPAAGAAAPPSAPPADDAQAALADARYTIAPRTRFAPPAARAAASAQPSAEAGAGGARLPGPCADARIPEFPAYPELHAGDRERLPLTVRVTIDGAGRIIRVQPEARPNQLPLAYELRAWLGAQRVHPVICNGTGVRAEILLEYEWVE